MRTVSGNREGCKEIEKRLIVFLSRYAARNNTMIEALAFTEKEYQKIDQRCLLARIVQTGKKYKILQLFNNL